MLRRTTPLILALLSIATACSDDWPISPRGSDDVFTATVDGEAWTGRVQRPVTRYDGFALNLLGVDGLIEIGLTLNAAHPDATVPGTLDLTEGIAGAHLNEGDDTWFPTGEGGSGTLTITELTSRRARGTFSFVGGPLGGSATGTRTVTDGSFDVSF